MRADPPIDSFRCPLRAACLARPEAPFETRSEANAAVEHYQACSCPVVKAKHAQNLYARHALLMRKALGCFCPQSACYPGGCLPEELLGDTYPIFLKILDAYRPSFGLDFLGYASQRVRWALQHRARGHDRADKRSREEVQEGDHLHVDTEARVLDRVFADKLLGRLPLEDADLLRLKYGLGFSTKELAERFGVSGATLRKRCERARRRLNENENEASGGRGGAPSAEA
ncbi:MAG: hypothetical protein BMS9Abin29_1774 [Gemmatimonadota bacterium]|nr:MAG: hypothetical protein BMS9Abin29_1774 [Gemmatimonadota bacterium]